MQSSRSYVRNGKVVKRNHRVANHAQRITHANLASHLGSLNLRESVGDHEDDQGTGPRVDNTKSI